MYRAHHPRWAFEPVSGAGASLHGGRFNPKNLPALYTSLRMETAWLEAQQSFPFKAQPMTICAYAVDCADIVDLADLHERERLGVAARDLACAWEDIASRGGVPPSWILAQKLIAGVAAGMIAPSFAPGAGERDMNVVFWRWSGAPPHMLVAIGDFGRLPQDDASWR